ncbi:MAG: hypothetical protein EBX11_07695, partial [Actinobacteria bacterium]|nr:hypothetical protein [Actinomycetota bacterium]
MRGHALALAERADRLPAGRMPPQQLLPCLAAQTPSLDAFHFACSLTVVDAGILGSGGSEGKDAAGLPLTLMRKWRVVPHPAYFLGWSRTSCRLCSQAVFPRN